MIHKRTQPRALNINKHQDWLALTLRDKVFAGMSDDVIKILCPSRGEQAKGKERHNV